MVTFTRPKDLPVALSVSETSSLVVDIDTSVVQATPKQIVDAGRPVASDAEAIAGTNNKVSMTPLTTRQAIDADTTGSIAKAKAWAESDTAPGDPGTKSAKTWAEDAAEAASKAAGNAYKLHSLDLPRVQGVALQNRHFFAGPMVSDDTVNAENILQLFTVGTAHGRVNSDDTGTKRDVGRLIYTARSYDGGHTFKSWNPLPGQTSIDGTDIGYDWHGVQIVKTGTGRLIILALRRDSSNAVTNVAWLSDTLGQGWTGPIVIGNPGGMVYFPHSAMTVPAADGGHDTENATFFCYGGGQFRTLWTNDNGDTWEYAISGVEAGKTLSEPWVFRADDGKYVCIARDETSLTSQGWAFTTTSPLGSWGSGRDCGLQIGSNPPFAAPITSDGYVDLYTRSIMNRSSVGVNRIAWAREKAIEVYNNGGQFTNPLVDAGPLPSHLTAYWWHVNHLGRDIFCCTNERDPWNTSRPAESQAIYFTPDKPVPLTVGAVRDMTLTKNLLDNAGFHYTPFGTSFSALASGNIACRWVWDGSGATADINLLPLPDFMQRTSLLGNKYGLRIQSVTRDTDSSFTQTFKGIESLKRFANRRLNFAGKAFGSGPSLFFNILVSYGSGGSSSFTERATLKENPSGGVSLLSGSVAAPDIAGKTITEDCYVRVKITAPSDLVDWDFWFYDWELTLGDWPRPTLPVNPKEELNYLQGFTEVLTYKAASEICDLTKSNSNSSVFQGRFSYAPKHYLPSAPTIITGSAASLVFVAPVTADVVPTSATFANADYRSARVAIALPSAHAKDTARLTASTDFEVLVSCE